jgi:hypothetical protein
MSSPIGLTWAHTKASGARGVWGEDGQLCVFHLHTCGLAPAAETNHTDQVPQATKIHHLSVWEEEVQDEGVARLVPPQTYLLGL